MLAEDELPALAGLTCERIRARLGARLDALTRRGLGLRDGGAPVATRYLMVGDYFPPDTGLATLAAPGIIVSADLAADA